jgi:hypothetical protein
MKTSAGLYVLAGNHRQFTDFARANPALSRDSLIYVHSPWDIRGRNFDGFVVIGTFWSRRDALDIWEEMSSRRFKKFDAGQFRAST